MKRTIRQWGFAGAALCCCAVSGAAGEGVKYQFDGWTVTVTPRRTVPLITGRDKITTDRSKPSSVLKETAEPDANRVRIRPISMRHDVSVPQPAPVLIESDPELQLKSQPEPTIAATASPVPMTEQQVFVPTDYVMGLPIITPRPTFESIQPQVVVPQTASYRDIYNSIPFNRAEYEAYPSYRHDATMEFLFNQMRPTVIQRGTTNVNHFGMGYGGYGGSGFSNGFPYTYPYQPYYPFSYGLRLHRSP